MQPGEAGRRRPCTAALGDAQLVMEDGNRYKRQFRQTPDCAFRQRDSEGDLTTARTGAGMDSSIPGTKIRWGSQNHSTNSP